MDQTKTELEHHIEKELPCCTSSDQKAEQEKSYGKKDRFLGVCIVVAGLVIGGAWVYTAQFKNPNPEMANATIRAALEKVIVPKAGVAVPVAWGNLGQQMIKAGVIDQKKFENLYAQRGGLDEATQKLLTGSDNGKLVITAQNAGTMLNLFWALGLANKNSILERGPMVDKHYGGDPSKFASTGGWTLATGNPMNHYSRHAMIRLTPEQQSVVEDIAQHMYRPCCGNSTHFPDCNHGMAMLGLLELMASQGVSERDMYKAALAVNAYWFPDTYMTIGGYLRSKGSDWKNTSPKTILGKEYSSAQGYQAIVKEFQSSDRTSGGSCGV